MATAGPTAGSTCSGWHRPDRPAHRSRSAAAPSEPAPGSRRPGSPWVPQARANGNRTSRIPPRPYAGPGRAVTSWTVPAAGSAGRRRQAWFAGGHAVLRSARSGQRAQRRAVTSPLCITCSPRGLRLGEGPGDGAEGASRRSPGRAEPRKSQQRRHKPRTAVDEPTVSSQLEPRIRMDLDGLVGLEVGPDLCADRRRR
jgi:hypothetical protein